MKTMILIPLTLLAACSAKEQARPEPIVVIQKVNVPVSAPCIPSNYDTKRPDYVDSNEALKTAVDAAERYQLLWGGRSQRIAREKENETVIAGCPQGK